MRTSSMCRAERWLATAKHVRMVRSASGVTMETQVPVDSLTMIGLSNIDAQFLEFARIEEAVAVISDAADEGRLASKLRKGNDGIGDRSAADQLRLVFLKAIEQGFLFGEIDEPHGAPLKSKRSELGFGDFQENVNKGVAQAAELEFFHLVIFTLFFHKFLRNPALRRPKMPTPYWRLL